MPPARTAPRPRIACFLITVACLLSGVALPAQSVGSGVIAGRIFNPATGQYLRNAEIRVVATGQAVTSGNEGDFRISPVAAGQAKLVVTYTGYRTATAIVDVTAGATVMRDFDLISSLQAGGAAGEPVKLGAFVVAGEREGNAKAIMDQRRSMNITNTVASDVFGDNSEGNVGEFLKHLPGVEVEMSFGEIRNVSLRGLGSEYTAVTLDGVSLASADPSSTGGGSDARVFTFEQVSLSSMDTIEVSKTVSADVDANAPAGTINLKTKRAFERAGRRVTVQANVAAHSEELNLRKSSGPGEEMQSRKLRPGGIFEYSDIFLQKRLGVILNISESNLYQEVLATSLTYNRGPTTADPRPVVITAIGMTHSPRFNERFTTTLTTDFKATPQLVLSLGLIYNWSNLWMAQQVVDFTAGARTAISGAEPLVSFTSSSAGTVAVAPSRNSKAGQTFSYLPKFEYKLGDLLIEGRFAESVSRGWYDPLNQRGTIRNMVSPTASNVTFRAERSSDTSADWKITQVAGRDLANGANFTSPEANINDGRSLRAQIYSGEITATLKTNCFLPVTWKTGVKSKHETFDLKNLLGSIRYNYVGPGSGPVGGWAGFTSPLGIDLGMLGGGVTTASGQPLFMPDMRRIGQTYLSRPDYFQLCLPVNNYFNANVANTRHYEEQVDAAFAMGTTTLGKVTFRAGLRWEQTGTDSLEFDPLTNAEVRAAGFPATSRATTIPGIAYQFFTKPRIHRTGGYDNLFPSASFKYALHPNLSFHLGYSSTVRRPEISQIAGVWLVNDQTLRATVPNVSLRPETSDNYSARLAYYFEPVGLLGINFYQNSVKDLLQSLDLTAEEFGYTESDLARYTFVSTTNVPGRVQIRGMELEYSQSLSFLPRPLKGLSVRASYTRNYAEIRRPSMSPHTASSGLSYSGGRFNASLNGKWSDNVPTNEAGNNYVRHRTSLDASGGFRLTPRYSLFASARNLTNAAYITMQTRAGSPPMWSAYQVWGTTWTCGVKGVF